MNSLIVDHWVVKYSVHSNNCVITEKPYSKPVKRKIVYIPVTTSKNTENPYSKSIERKVVQTLLYEAVPLCERKVVYIPIITSSHATSVKSK